MLCESGLKAELLVIPDQLQLEHFRGYILWFIVLGWLEVCLQLVAPELPAGWSSTCAQVFPCVLSASEIYFSFGRGSAAAVPVYRQAFLFACLRL